MFEHDIDLDFAHIGFFPVHTLTVLNTFHFLNDKSIIFCGSSSFYNAFSVIVRIYIAHNLTFVLNSV